MMFLLILFFALKRLRSQQKLESGLLFQYFMLSYFGFRFLLEFIKPNVFLWIGLSSIQWLCVICFLYYRKTIVNLFRNAY